MPYIVGRLPRYKQTFSGGVGKETKRTGVVA